MDKHTDVHKGCCAKQGAAMAVSSQCRDGDMHQMLNIHTYVSSFLQCEGCGGRMYLLAKLLPTTRRKNNTMSFSTFDFCENDKKKQEFFHFSLVQIKGSSAVLTSVWKLVVHEIVGALWPF